MLNFLYKFAVRVLRITSSSLAYLVIYSKYWVVVEELYNTFNCYVEAQDAGAVMNLAQNV